MVSNAFKPGSLEENHWLSTVQDEDIVPYGFSIGGDIAGANLPTSDADRYEKLKFVVLRSRAVP